MSPDPFDRKLDAYAKRLLPATPRDIAAGVWQEIERRRHETLAARLGWHELLKRPAWALAGLGFAVALGAVPAATWSRLQEARRLARDSLHFEVFSPHARGQIASVLTQPDSSATPQRSP